MKINNISKNNLQIKAAEIKNKAESNFIKTIQKSLIKSPQTKLDTENLLLSKMAYNTLNANNPETILNALVTKLNFELPQQLAFLYQTMSQSDILNYLKNKVSDELYKNLENNIELNDFFINGKNEYLSIAKLKVYCINEKDKSYKIEKVINSLNCFMPLATEIIKQSNGIIEYINAKEISFYFGIPKNYINISKQLTALNTAVLLQKNTFYLNKILSKHNYPEIEISICVDYGLVKTGFIGNTKTNGFFTLFGNPIDNLNEFSDRMDLGKIYINESLIEFVEENYNLNPIPKMLNSKFYEVYF